MPAEATILQGDCRETLRTLDADSIQTCVTSPPYWGLRDYGHDGQLGLESTPDAYVAAMVNVFREVRRVLKPDGTLWLNLGDSYAGSWKNQGRKEERGSQRPINGPMLQSFNGHPAPQSNAGVVPPGLKPKDLCGIPWRVAFALQADGWWLRSDIIWAKPNPMPESVTDRPTKAHEYVFLLAKSESYFFDAKAIAEPSIDPPGVGRGGSLSRFGPDETLIAANAHRGNKPAVSNGIRNARSVWPIASEPYDGAHFAVMPSALAARCILAGSRMGDTVLDPFLGSGTVGMVAEQLGRRWVGCELNPEFVELAAQRTRQRGLFANAG